MNLLRRLPDAEMQDVEVNSLLQGQSIRIENCADVRISVRQVEVENVVEIGLAMLPCWSGKSAERSPWTVTIGPNHLRPMSLGEEPAKVVIRRRRSDDDRPHQVVGNRQLGRLPLMGGYYDYANDGLRWGTDDDEFLWFLEFSCENHFQKNGNAYLGDFTIFTPVSQRFQWLFSVPFIQAATKRRELTNASDLTFGIGTVFITDPEGNVIEFMQADRGIFAKYHF